MGFVGMAFGQVNITGTQEVPTPQPQQSNPVFERPIDRSMVFIYDMVRHFLEQTLHPKSLKVLVDDLKIDISNMDELYKSLTSKSSAWIAHYSSVAACVLIGIIIAVAMVIIGVVFCLCRCCGKCGAKTDEMEGRFAWWQRFVLNILLGLLMTLSLIGVTATFIAGQLVYEQTRESGVTAALTESLTDIDMYKDSTLNSFEVVIFGKIDDTKEKFFQQLDSVPEVVKDLLGNETGAGDALERFVNFGIKLPALQQDLTSMKVIPGELELLSPQITGNLSELNRTIMSDLVTHCPNINPEMCNSSIFLLTELQVDINFSQVDNVSVALEMVQIANSGGEVFGNITALALNLSANFDSVAKTINNTVSSSLTDVKTKTIEIQNKVGDFVNQTTHELRQLNLAPARKFVKDTIEPPLVKYGYYVWIGAVVLSCMLLLIVAFYFIALLFGSCGERNSDDIEARFCNRGNGACSLMAGVIFTFLFFWLLLLLTALLFLVGGLTHTELCRHLVDPVDTASVSVLEEIMQKNLNTSLKIMDTMNNCKEDQALYTAANIAVVYPELNLTSFTDLKQYDIERTINEIKSTNIDIGDIEIVNDLVYNITDFLSGPLESINFQTYHNALKSQIIIGNLALLQTALNALAQSVNGSVGDAFRNRSAAVRSLSSGIVQEAFRLKSTLSSAVHSAEKIIKDAQLSSLYMKLKSAQDIINANGNRIVRGLINQTADGMYVTLQELVEDIAVSVRTDIGRCRPVYSAVMLSVTGVCQRFLYPFNAFWFTVGWCLFLLVPCMVIAIFLTNLYKKTAKYEKNDQDELLPPRNHRPPQEGIRNQAFQEEQETNMADYERQYQVRPRGASPPKAKARKGGKKHHDENNTRF